MEKSSDPTFILKLSNCHFKLEMLTNAVVTSEIKFYLKIISAFADIRLK